MGNSKGMLYWVFLGNEAEYWVAHRVAHCSGLCLPAIASAAPFPMGEEQKLCPGALTVFEGGLDSPLLVGIHSGIGVC